MLKYELTRRGILEHPNLYVLEALPSLHTYYFPLERRDKQVLQKEAIMYNNQSLGLYNRGISTMKSTAL